MSASPKSALLQNKVIIVTGAGSGMGLSVARLASEAGASVVLAGSGETSLTEAAATIEKEGGQAYPIVADMRVEGDIEAMVAKAVERFGKIDGAFNNAGVRMHDKPLYELTADDWDSVQSVNARGVFLCMKYETAAMRLTGGGVIVNNCSIDGVMAVPRWSEYTASKHAVAGLTRAGSTEAGSTHVRVNAVLPGYIITPMTEPLLSDPSKKAENDAALERHSVGRFGQPDDVGYAVRWLLSDEAAFVNGALLPVDGGWTAR